MRQLNPQILHDYLGLIYINLERDGDIVYLHLKPDSKNTTQLQDY